MNQEKANVIFNNNTKRNIEVKVFNILGSEVINVFSGNLDKGFQSFEMNLSLIDNGVYFLSISSEGEILETTKMMIQ